MKLFTIWSAGRRITDTFESPVWLGKVQADSFQEACDKLFNQPTDKPYYNSKECTYNGIKLFGSEYEAENHNKE